MPPTRNLVLVIFLALSLFSASCDGGSLLQTETSCHRRRHHHRHRCHHRKHHKGGHRHHNHLKGRKQPHQKVLSVDDFGAKGDGTTDDSEAFLRAWNKFCNSRGSMLVIPNRRTYMLSPTHFSGPCYPNLKLRLYGTIKAYGNKNDYKNDRHRWLKFSDLKNFMVDGGGVIDGNGQQWWKESCKVQKSEICDRPFAVTFQNGTNISVKDLLFKNSPKMHLVFLESESIRASNIVIQAPGDSPNTDGIHISHTTDVEITNSVIATGDDCISIVNESKNVRVSRIVCGPGHGISIGSLGKNYDLEEHVTNIIVDTVVFKGTTNGVRIKTWQGGNGYARNILFDNIVMHNVTNPIIIDQFYCDNPKDNYGNVLPCPEKVEAVGVSNVVYRNIRGTSARELAIRFECSKTVPCKGILLENVNLIGEDKGVVKAECSNVKYANIGHVFPSCGG
ncbi:polygalacturonase QRT2-like isoform X1 [Ipomoea triloba]|uniref:polygalacturonase QRT2-like isoform X1 n=1 Tax=Ipomoea triloba TaxID=35885 RepID=UPI00125D5B54|nr:polygalacturonase QRT2-like isoform X1 [Ipomoea triloba]